MTVTDAELAVRVRTALAAVADAVGEQNAPPAARLQAVVADVARPARRRRAALAAGGGLAALALVASASLPGGSEDVQELPPSDALIEDSVEGVRFWLVPSFHRDVCDQPMEGVELVSGATNKVGMEWNTGGLAYGDQLETRPGCLQFNQASWLADPSRIAVSWMRLGTDNDGPWGATLAAHPSAAAVVVDGAGIPMHTVDALPREDAPDGPRYAAVGVPEDAVVVTLTVVDADGRELAAETRDVSQFGR
jgi:hypothetical protein